MRQRRRGISGERHEPKTGEEVEREPTAGRNKHHHRLDAAAASLDFAEIYTADSTMETAAEGHKRAEGERNIRHAYKD